MSVEKSPQYPEGMNNPEFEQIKLLLNKLEFIPELHQDYTAVFDKDEYPDLLYKYGFNCVEVQVDDSGMVKVEITYPPSNSEQRIDLYAYHPSGAVVHGSATGSINERLVSLQDQFNEVQGQIQQHRETTGNAYEQMMDIVQEMEIDEHDALLDDYTALEDLIADWRKMVYDTDKQNADWQHSLDIREAENQMRIHHLLEGLSLTDSAIDELLVSYRAGRLGMALGRAQLSVLTDQMVQVTDTKASEFIAASPQEFIDLMNMLLELVEDTPEEDQENY